MGQYIRTSSGTFTGGTVAGATNFSAMISSGGTDLSVLINNAYFTGGTVPGATNFTSTISSGGTDLSALFGPTSPAGSTGEIQYNAAGAFGAENTFRYLSSENRMIIGTPSTPADLGESILSSGSIRVIGTLSASTDVHIGKRAIFVSIEKQLSSIGDNTIDCSLGSIQRFSVDTSPVTLVYSNAAVGTYIFVLTNSGTRTVSLKTASGWHTPGGSAISYNTSSGAVNIITAIYEGSKMMVTSTSNYTQV